MFEFQEFLTEAAMFQFHHILNPKLWEGYHLEDEVREDLLKIAHAWIDFAGITPSAVKDIILTGGNCNYSYTEFSDIDIHIITDYSKMIVGYRGIGNPPDKFLEQHLYNQKNLWAYQHPNISVKGYPVELFAEDSKERYEDQGRFSLLKNRWIQFPKREAPKVDSRLLEIKLKHVENSIKLCIDCNDLQLAQSIKDRLIKVRQSGIKRGGEFSPENLVYKSLRGNGTLDRLNTFINLSYDRSLSI